MDDGLCGEMGVKGLCITIFACVAIFGIILIYLGTASIEPTEVGLDYSWISQTINSEVKYSGFFFLGIGHSLIKFPLNVQTIDFSKDRYADRGAIQSRTFDGLEVILEISFQYELQSENIFKLYSLYGEDYRYVLQNIAVDLLTDEATKYTAYDFFMDRGRIKDNLQLKLNRVLNEMVFANIVFLQLRSVDLPDPFENAIQESEVKKQDIQKANAEYNKVRIELDTLIQSAYFQKNITINNAKGVAESILKQNDADVQSLEKLQCSQADGFQNVKQTMGLTNDELLLFMKSKLIKTYRGSNLVLNIESPEKK